MLQRVMPSTEFTYWCAMEMVDPGFPVRADMHAAQISAAIINAMKTQGPPVDLNDLMLRFDVPQEKTVEDIGSMLELWTDMVNRK